LILTAPDLL
jgi:hypothetical protein